MRNFLAVLLAVVAGVTAALGLVAWKLDGLIHQPEPVQDMLGSGEAAEEFKSAVPDALGSMADDTTGVAVIDEALGAAISAVAGELRSHPDFDEAWAQSLELTRTNWVDQISTLRDRMNAGEPIAENSTEAQLQLRLDPIGQLAVSELPGGEELATDDATEISVQTAIPPVSMLTAEQVVLAEELITLWPVVLVIGGIVFLMALLIATNGSRWIPWLVTGLVVAVSGAATKFGFSQMQNDLLERAEGSPAHSLMQPLLRAVQDWADPQIIVLLVAGGGLAILGIVGGLIASNRRRVGTYER